MEFILCIPISFGREESFNPLPRLERGTHTLMWSCERKRKIPFLDLIKRPREGCGSWRRKNTDPRYLRKAYPIYKEKLYSLHGIAWLISSNIRELRESPLLRLRLRVEVEGKSFGFLAPTSSSPRITLKSFFPRGYPYLLWIFVRMSYVRYVLIVSMSIS